MKQASMLTPEPAPVWSVTDLTRYVRDLLESDHNLQDVWVSGEVSNLSQPKSGHIYFTIKDAKASLRCVMWRSNAARLRFVPQDGDAIEVHGKISVYETAGQYQLYAETIRQTGEGALYQQFLRLKARLEAEGLFDEDRKRPIPAWPQRIGIVTSPTGAALQDMLNTLRRRFPLVNVVLAPATVQGDDAPPEIVRGLLTLNSVARPDVIILARGGGSIEDLWAFNDEYVARAIVSSEAPVITGVGHETDFTIADFAADLRAPTPTAAAEVATPDQVELHQDLSERQQQIDRIFENMVNNQRWALGDLRGRLRQHTPETHIRDDRQRLDEWERRAASGLKHLIRYRRSDLRGGEQQLHALNPMGVLQRGFALVTRADGEIVRRVGQVRPGDAVDVRVSDGTFGARVESEP